MLRIRNKYRHIKIWNNVSFRPQAGLLCNGFRSEHNSRFHSTIVHFLSHYSICLCNRPLLLLFLVFIRKGNILKWQHLNSFFKHWEQQKPGQTRRVSGRMKEVFYTPAHFSRDVARIPNILIRMWWREGKLRPPLVCVQVLICLIVPGLAATWQPGHDSVQASLAARLPNKGENFEGTVIFGTSTGLN